ncbi:hypothetical protein [Streptomyces buecherae]|uniref:hypothetical protein n=1 Tax=Streptomyces buecherae TaxID=2763006 RepID=UPI001C277A8C|nr:hypothetical protein [Streptomyces buecherae]
MTISISLVLLLGVGVALAMKLRSATLGAVLVAALFGFYVAGTDAAPTVRDATTAITDAIPGAGN